MGTETNCPGCGEPMRTEDEFCAGCGVARGADGTDEPTTARPRARSRTARADAARSRDIKKAAAWILILAIVFAIAGTIYGFVVKGQADDALVQLSSHADSEMVILQDGTVTTVADLRADLSTTVLLAFGLNYLLAAIMVALHFWARVNPFPAIVSALLVFVGVNVLGALINPATLLSGLLIKIPAIIMLFGGLQAALADRAARRRGSGPRAPRERVDRGRRDPTASRRRGRR